MNRWNWYLSKLVFVASLAMAGCGASPGVHNEWTWQGGSDTAYPTAVYGTRGVASPSNTPGPRDGATSWTDAKGNLWLFGGFGTDAAGNGGRLNDLWEYKAGQWIWVSGSNFSLQGGIYGTRGKATPSNVPGARREASGWTDKSGNLWLFGGSGYDSADVFGTLNDLWEFSGGAWTWMSGSNLANSVGHVGTQGTSDPGNFPASRKGAGSWTDGDGNLWLFGGDAAEVTDPSYFYNNLWKYSPSTNEWTWVGGTIRVNGAGVYGMQGVPDPTNVPGARSNAVAWTDHSGNVWLFGGGIPEGCMNDLWKYSKGEWTWMGGSKGANQSGTYGTQGTAATGNYPGARCDGSAGWTDASGNLWLFGGSGFDSTGTAGQLNDLWKFDGSHWAWAGGSKSTSQPGRYGALGKASATGFPGARMFSVSWSDASGNLWLFGGIGLDSTGMGGDLNDLWEYQP